MCVQILAQPISDTCPSRLRPFARILPSVEGIPEALQWCLLRKEKKRKKKNRARKKGVVFELARGGRGTKAKPKSEEKKKKMRKKKRKKIEK